LMRAIPVEKAIEHLPERVKYEEVSYWLDWAGESIAVAPCECRKLRRMAGEGTSKLESETCISLGKYAESCIRMGKARRISREEAEAILAEAERQGYVHQLSNIDGPDHSIFICNCSWDSCMALKTSWYTQSPSLSRSNYVAEVDPAKCVACGGCVEVCPQNATKLGQKLCQQKPAKIKNKEIPDNHLWFGSKHWQPDFLTNRDNVVPETGTSPCKTNCPAHIAVQGYIKMAGEGRYREALELIKKENPFPAVCGRICGRFCEQECTRGEFDDAVAIDEVKRFIAELELQQENRYVPEKMNNKGHKIAVIGAGPAGLSCAYYLAVLGHDVTVFEKNAQPGGMMMYGIPSFRLEKSLIMAEIEVLKELGVKIQCNTEVGKTVTIQQLREQGFKGFYVAPGLQGSGKLNIPGEELPHVKSGIELMHQVNSGEEVKLSGKVVVVGGGNVACDIARTAVRCGAEEVDMYCLESYNEMPASPDEKAEAEHEGIKIHAGWGPMEITEGTIKFKKCTRVKDEEGRFSPQYDENDTVTAEATVVFCSIGQRAEWGNLLDGLNVQLNRNGTAQADSWTYQTAEEDVFVGGDIYTGAKFVIHAIAAGKEGADSLHRYVWEGHSLTLGRVKRDNYHQIDKNNLAPVEYDSCARQKPEIDESKVCTFFDERGVLNEEQIKKEAARCLSCGAARVDPNICIGCGLCTTRCKFDAIKLNRKYDKWGVPYENIVGHVAKEYVKKVGRVITRQKV
ncbi:MAG: FAD-dependent oxidoreductase, partial [Firmicutes bacterium]|nr:FAD-dependent oxidoreductase [Bacillota bacterium]